MDAKALFELLRSPTGFKIIDPDTKNHEDEPAKTLTGYDDSEWDKVILTYAKTELPWPFGPRYFTSFCAGNKAKMLFLGKSIIDPDIVPDKGRIKCLTTYAYRVVPLKDGRCRLKQICYLDMGGSSPTCLINLLVRKGYFQGLHKRLVDHLEGDLKAVDPDEVELKP